MSTNYGTRYAASPTDVKSYDTSRLRKEFLIDNLMVKNGSINNTIIKQGEILKNK